MACLNCLGRGGSDCEVTHGWFHALGPLHTFSPDKKKQKNIPLSPENRILVKYCPRFPKKSWSPTDIFIRLLPMMNCFFSGPRS